MKLKPSSDKVLIEPIIEADSKTKGGLWLPESAKEQKTIGIVIAIGNGRRNENGTRTPIEYRVGDKVLYSKYGGTEVKIDGKELKLISEDDILATIED